MEKSYRNCDNVVKNKGKNVITFSKRKNKISSKCRKKS